MGPDTALVQTVDFFTPIVDDPYTFGQIAATNSLSDVYAMGGRPLTAMAMVCFPEKADLEILERILAGGLSKMIEAGCTVIGGHSIRDEETKFGYSVTGLIDPHRVLKNGGAKAGDKLIFTKAFGTGVISTAIKKGVAKQSWIDAAIASMTTLNKVAAEVITSLRGEARALAEPALSDPPQRGSQASSARQSPVAGFASDVRPTTYDGFPNDQRRTTNSASANDQRPRTNDESADDQRPFLACPELSEGTDDGLPIHALTDVTGFGLVGHLREMLLASEGVSATLHSSRVPLLEGALECIRAGYIPGGLNANREFAECMVTYDNDVPEEIRTVLFDPQTAGGLLASVAPESAQELLYALRAVRVPAEEIGEVAAAPKPGIHVAR